MALVTDVVVAPEMIATRAPSRAALVMICSTMTARPYSIIPNSSTKNTGATNANSTAAAPCRRGRRELPRTAWYFEGFGTKRDCLFCRRRSNANITTYAFGFAVTDSQYRANGPGQTKVVQKTGRAPQFVA